MLKNILLVAFTVAIFFLSLYKINASGEDMEALLESSDPAVRCNSAMEVGEKNKTKYTKKLKHLLKDKDGRVQYCAAWSLTKLGKKEGIIKLLEIIQSEEAMEDLSEGFDYKLLAKSLKIKEPEDTFEWRKMLAKHPRWKK